MCTKRYMMRAFTLIELLIVIVIIGILAVSLVPRLTGAQDRAKITGIKALLNQAYTQAQIYHMNNGGTYAGLCNDTTIQGIISSLGGSGYAACYIHTTVVATDWGIAVTFKGTHYLAGPQGVMVLDSTNTGGTQSWESATNACQSQGKHVPNSSSLKALWNITNSTPSGLTASTYRSSTENPNDGSFAYRLNMSTGSGPSNYVKTNNYRVRCASTQ